MNSVFIALISLLPLQYTRAQSMVKQQQEKSIVVVIASYNNKNWYQRNLDSVFSQQYENYTVIYIDDCSPDGTGEFVEQYIKEQGQEHRVKLIRNKERCGALANLYKAIHSCDNSTIIVTLDGDDWFAHEQVLPRINDVYANPNIWLTYGQYEDYPKATVGCCREIPKDIINNSLFREYTWVSSHLRTFYAGLFKRVKLEDLLYQGAFFPMTWDMAFMLPMLEMSGGRFAFIPEVLYQYNVINPLNDCKVNLRLQEYLDKFIRSKPRYQRLEGIMPWEKESNNATADMVIYSYDRPLQLYALLESVEKYVTDLGMIYVVYKTSDDTYAQAYQKVQERFSQVRFIGQTNQNNFKQLTLQCIYEAPNDYVLFAVDDLIVTDYVNIVHCLRAMESSRAYAFYLRLGKNLSHCYSMNLEQKIPPCIHIHNDIYAWQFAVGEYDWKYPNNVDMTLYRKLDIRNKLEEMDYNSPNTMEWHWAIGVDFNKVGLFFEHSKMVNIPLNVVQHDEPDNIHMDMYSTSTLLETFNADMKMDIAPLFHINNQSAHMEYEPTFTQR